MIDNKDITVVVQGPVQALPDRDQDTGITEVCLNSVRTFLPGARTILSTWKDQDLEGLDFDELVINEDPGANITSYRENGEPGKENYNRQIASTRGGLDRVRTRYVVKLRSDNYLTGNGFKTLQQHFPERGRNYRFSRERVVTNSTYTRRYARGIRVAFHSCDFFYFGLTDDVFDMWDLPLFEDLAFDPAKQGKKQHRGAPLHAPAAEQDIWLRYLNKHLAEPIELKHLFDTSPELLQVSEQCFANNLVVAGLDEIGLALPSKFAGGTRAVKTSSLIAYLSHLDWQQLYRRYCDPEFEIEFPPGHTLRMAFWRGVYLPYRSVGTRLHLLMNRLR